MKHFFYLLEVPESNLIEAFQYYPMIIKGRILPFLTINGLYKCFGL